MATEYLLIEWHTGIAAYMTSRLATRNLNLYNAPAKEEAFLQKNRVIRIIRTSLVL